MQWDKLLREADRQLHQNRKSRTESETFMSRLEVAERRDQQREERQSADARTSVAEKLAKMVAEKRAARDRAYLMGAARMDDERMVTQAGERSRGQAQAAQAQAAQGARVSFDNWSLDEGKLRRDGTKDRMKHGRTLKVEESSESRASVA